MKKVFAGIAALGVILVAALLIVPSFIDWSSYRAVITEQAKKHTGRDLIIGGAIDLTLLPSPVVRVNDLHFSNAQGAQAPTMVSVRQLDVSVSLLSLLKGDIHINSLRLIDPVVSLEKMANGQGNWIFQATEQSAEVTPNGSSSAGSVASDESAALPIQIDDFVIERGSLVYQDAQTGQSHRLDELNSRFAIASLQGPFETVGTAQYQGQVFGFDLSVGSLVNGRTVSFNGGVKTAYGKGEVRLSGTGVLLDAGPKVSARLSVKADSLGDFVGGLGGQTEISSALNAPFEAAGNFTFQDGTLSFDQAGLPMTLGTQRAKFDLNGQVTPRLDLQARLEMQTLALDPIMVAAPYVLEEPTPLPPVIRLTQAPESQMKGGRVSAALGAASRPQTEQEETISGGFQGIDGRVTFGIDVGALLYKGDAIRQFRLDAALEDELFSLDQLSAELPGAARVSAFGSGGFDQGGPSFDGALELHAATLRTTLNWLGIETPSVPAHRLRQVRVQTAVSLGQEALSFTDATVMVDDTEASLAATIALQQRPSFGLRFRLGHLNIDDYQVVKATQVSSNSQTTGQAIGQDTAAASAQSAQSEASAAQKMATALANFKVLKNFDANIDLGVERLTYQGHSYGGLQADALIYDGAVTLRNLQVKDAAGVRLAAKGTLREKNRLLHLEGLEASAETKNARQFAASFLPDTGVDWRRLGALTVQIKGNGPVLAPNLSTAVSTAHGNVSFAGDVTILPLPVVSGKARLDVTNWPRLMRALPTDYRPKGGSFKGDFALTAQPTQVAISDLSLKIGQAQVTGAGTVQLAQPMTANVSLASAGLLKLDSFLDGRSGAKAAPSAGKKRQGKTKKQGTTEAQKAGLSSRWSHDDLGLQALRNLVATVAVQAEAVQVQGFSLKAVDGAFQIQNGILSLEKGNLSLWSGRIESQGTLDANNQGSLAGQVKAQNIDLAQALRGLGLAPYATGQGSFTTTVTATGQTQAQWVQSLAGTVSSRLDNVRADEAGTKGSVFDLLSFVSTLSGADPRKSVASVHLQGPIQNGVLTLEQADLRSQIANADASGQVNLPAWTLDVAGNLNVQQNLLLGLLAQKGKVKSEYPFAFSGPLDAPNVKLDSGGINSGGGLVIPLSDDLEKKGVGALLRGVLGSSGIQVEQPKQNQEETQQQPEPSSAPSQEEQLIRGLGELFKKLR